jgi:hypothetical protein
MYAYPMRWLGEAPRNHGGLFYWRSLMHLGLASLFARAGRDERIKKRSPKQAGDLALATSPGHFNRRVRIGSPGSSTRSSEEAGRYRADFAFEFGRIYIVWTIVIFYYLQQ